MQFIERRQSERLKLDFAGVTIDAWESLLKGESHIEVLVSDVRRTTGKVSVGIDGPDSVKVICVERVKRKPTREEIEERTE